jgi:hypothetical protein
MMRMCQFCKKHFPIIIEMRRWSKKLWLLHWSPKKAARTRIAVLSFSKTLQQLINQMMGPTRAILIWKLDHPLFKRRRRRL